MSKRSSDNIYSELLESDIKKEKDEIRTKKIETESPGMFEIASKSSVVSSGHMDKKIRTTESRSETLVNSESKRMQSSEVIESKQSESNVAGSDARQVLMFIASAVFIGRKPGYVFKRSDSGDLGYYLDDFDEAKRNLESSERLKIEESADTKAVQNTIAVDIDATLLRIEPHLANEKKFSKAADLFSQFIDSSLSPSSSSRFFKAIEQLVKACTFHSAEGLVDERFQGDYHKLFQAIYSKTGHFENPVEHYQIHSWILAIHTRALLVTDDSFQFRKAMDHLKACTEEISSTRRPSSRSTSDDYNDEKDNTDDSTEPEITDSTYRYRLAAILSCMETAYRNYPRDWAKNPIETAFVEASNRRLLFEPQLRERLDTITTNLTLERRKNASWAGTQTVRTFNSVAHPLLQKKVGILR